MSLYLTEGPAANQLLTDDPLALLIGMLLDQQVPLETAFAGPEKIKERFGSLDPAAIASADPEEFAQLCSTPPAVHRFPKAMAARIQELCRIVDSDWDGDAAAIWTKGEPNAEQVRARLQTLPGFGAQKARIFLALLGKQYDLNAPGWRVASEPFGESGTYMSVADITDPDSLQKVRAYKKSQKLAAKEAKSAGK